MDNVQERLAAMRTSDKIIGVGIIVAVLTALGFGLFYLLPIAIMLATNTIYFFAEIALLMVMAMVLLDKDTWTNVFYAWKGLSRRIRRTIVRIDPIGILDTAIKQFMQKLNDIDTDINTGDAAALQQKKAILEAVRDRDNELSIAKAAQAQGKDMQYRQHLVAAERNEKSATNMQDTLRTVEGAMESAKLARDFCATKIEDLKSQKRTLARELQSTTSAQRAVRRIKSMLGNSKDLEMTELAFEDIEQKTTLAIAEIDNFRRIINPALEAQSLQNDADYEHAMTRFKSFFQTGEIPALPPASGTPAVLPAAITIQKETVAK